MTDKEKELALYCLKASSDYHSETCEECINYPNCDHTGQDDVTETIIKALEKVPDGDYANRLRLSIIGEFLELRDIAGRYPAQPKWAAKDLKKFLIGYGYDDEELKWADNDMFVKGWYCASHALYEGLEKILSKLCIAEKEVEE